MIYDPQKNPRQTATGCRGFLIINDYNPVNVRTITGKVVTLQHTVFKRYQGMAKHGRQKIVGLSYASRVEDIVRIYDEHARSGLSNREILRRYIWPKYRICEKTFYNIINASADPRIIRKIADANRQLELF